MISLCSKFYYGEDKNENGKVKVSSKGITKCQNKLHWQRYKDALAGA